jgi:hypothetical protein
VRVYCPSAQLLKAGGLRCTIAVGPAADARRRSSAPLPLEPAHRPQAHQPRRPGRIGHRSPLPCRQYQPTLDTPPSTAPSPLALATGAPVRRLAARSRTHENPGRPDSNHMTRHGRTGCSRFAIRWSAVRVRSSRPLTKDKSRGGLDISTRVSHGDNRSTAAACVRPSIGRHRAPPANARSPLVEPSRSAIRSHRGLSSTSQAASE